MSECCTRRGWRGFDDRGAWVHPGIGAVVQRSAAGGFLWATAGNEGHEVELSEAQTAAERAAVEEALDALWSLGLVVVAVPAVDAQA